MIRILYCTTWYVLYNISWVNFNGLDRLCTGSNPLRFGRIHSSLKINCIIKRNKIKMVRAWVFSLVAIAAIMLVIVIVASRHCSCRSWLPLQVHSLPISSSSPPYIFLLFPSLFLVAPPSFICFVFLSLPQCSSLLPLFLCSSYFCSPTVSLPSLIIVPSLLFFV